KTLIDLAKKVEGTVRHASVHAAGLVISPTEMTNYTPLQRESNGDKIISQYDMFSISDDYEGVGLIKLDLLGIRNLSILGHATQIVKQNRGITVDLDSIPVDDQKAFELLAKGETMGLFQLEGSGMTRYLVELKPTSIFDIMVMVALYRPGPMNIIEDYIARKHNPNKITYYDPRMKEYLQNSLGLLVYQDDVLYTAINIAGYDWEEADKFRKAMGKKIPAEMAKQRDHFIEGCIVNGLTKEKAEGLYQLIKPFEGYGFNKAHAASYGRVAYQTAYMKANFPAIYMSSVLTADSGDVEKIAEIIAECKRMHIPILPPDINESFSQFTVIKDEENKLSSARIRFGLITIKNFGQGIATAIIEERKKGGKFVSLVNFLDRVKDKNLNKKSLEALIKAGALDSFGIDRGILLGNIEKLLEYNKEQEKQSIDQSSLFGLMSDTSSLPTLKLDDVPVIDQKEKLAWEKELLGLYISGHPLDRYREIISKRDMDIKKAKNTLKDGEIATLACIIEDIKSISTKNGDSMAFLRVADFSDTIEAVVFPRVLLEFRTAFTPDRCIAIKGKMSDRNGKKSIIVERVKALA
ncbi:MAG TPA: DNA polymerase III subunit alpha, partial [Candidatus Paceibacterota bacterium]